MENIVKKLQTEVGLSEEQAVKTLAVLKDFMDKEKLEIDWEKFFTGKYANFKDTVTSLWDKISDKADDYGDKISDKVEDLTTEAQRKLRDISKGKKE